MIKLVFCTVFLLLPFIVKAQQITCGSWSIDLDQATKMLTITDNSTGFVLKGVYAWATCGFEGTDVTTTLKSTSALSVTQTQENVEDCFGTGVQYNYSYRFGNGVTMTQSFAFYSERDYIITQLKLTTDAATTTIKSNTMVPVATVTEQQVLSTTSNRMLWIPWDNDGFVEYRSNSFNTEEYSYNATCLYNPSSRYGIVAGAVDHDNWKSAIHVAAVSPDKVSSLELISGYTDYYSRDKGKATLVDADTYEASETSGLDMPHGFVCGTSVASSRFVLGDFDDWRTGMETYGKACAAVVAPRTWEGGVPYGWSSWGGMETKVSYEGVMDVAEFLDKKIRVHGFHDEKGRIVLSLDSWWNENLSNAQLKQFVAYCKENNMIPGLYYGPFTDWSGDPNRTVSNTNYKLKDMWLKQNGKYRKLDGAYCLDPTHPGTKAEITNQMNYFKSLGIEYVKLDFLCNGAIEADSYYNSKITTGIQAYNFGMKIVRKQATYEDGHSMYLVLSIAPLFPSQYAHGRRISCDAWGNINNTRYVMNSTSYGWWLREVYLANDPDNMVLSSFKGHGDGKETEAENRARITNGAVTGAFIVGDNFSDNVIMDGGSPATSRDRAEKFLTIDEINEIPRTCSTFRPLYGNGSQSKNAENYMTYENDKYVYLACINYNTILTYLNTSISFKDLGMENADVGEIKELWTGEIVTPENDGVTVRVAPKDARIYRIAKNSTTGISDVDDGNGSAKEVKVCAVGNDVTVTSHDGKVAAVSVYDLSGKEIASEKNTSSNASVCIGGLKSGIYIIKVDTGCGMETVKVAM